MDEGLLGVWSSPCWGFNTGLRGVMCCGQEDLQAQIGNFPSISWQWQMHEVWP